jgi:hypothetical protein
MGDKRNVYRLLVGKPKGKRLLEIPRWKWVDNIKMDLGEIEWSGLAQDRDMWKTIVNLMM